MSQNLFSELDIALSDEVMRQLNELSTSMTYNERSIITHYTNSLEIPLDPSLDKFISDFKCTMSIVRIVPASYLIWHKDISPHRTCAINVPLKDYVDHRTYITEQDIMKSFGHRNDFPEEQKNIKIHRPYQIPYNYKHPYLINVSEKFHCVFNCSDEYRYLLGIQTGEIAYQEAQGYFKNLNLVKS